MNKTVSLLVALTQTRVFQDLMLRTTFGSDLRVASLPSSAVLHGLPKWTVGLSFKFIFLIINAHLLNKE